MVHCNFERFFHVVCNIDIRLCNVYLWRLCSLPVNSEADCQDTTMCEYHTKADLGEVEFWIVARLRVVVLRSKRVGLPEGQMALYLAL